MSYLTKFIQNTLTQKPASGDSISPHIIELAERVITWYEKRPIPDRWQPLQLGRAAAMFDTSRESMAIALQYAGFKESKSSSTSLWTRVKF